MSGFELGHGALLAAHHDVGTAAERLRSDRDSIDLAVRGFLGVGWTGDAADTFVDVWDEWRRGAQDVLDGLVAMGALLAAAENDYQQTDAEARAEMADVAGRLVHRLSA